MQTSLSAQNIIRLCEGDTAQHFAVPFSNGSTYNWTIGTQSIATITSGNGTEHILLDLNTPGVFWLHVLETDDNLCIGKDSILVEVYPKPTPFVYSLGNTTLCEGDFMTLISDSMYTSIIWSNGLNTDSIDVFTSGNYFVLVSDTNGCKNISNNIDVYFNPKPNPDFWIDGICFKSESNLIDVSTISTGNIVSWTWNLGDGSYNAGPTVSHLYSEVDLYNVTLIVQSDAGCEDSISKNLQIYHLPKAEFEYYPYSASTLNPEIIFTNKSVDAIPLLWDFGDGRDTTIENPIHVFSNPGIYEVMLTVLDTNNCMDSISHSITVYYDFLLYVPNSFSPNKDGKNEVFIPKGLRMAKYKSYTFVVYDRWGEEVFKTNDVGDGWSGENAIAGKYAWVIIIEDELGETRKKIGDVMLIK